MDMLTDPTKKLHETGPPPKRPKKLGFRRKVTIKPIKLDLTDTEKQLCDSFLDTLAWHDLANIIPEANKKPRSVSYEIMSNLVVELKDSQNVQAATMLKLLKKLGLKMARV